jgi:hypothetical protein
LAGLQIDRAVNVDALTPARLLDRELLLARRPAAGGPRGMGWMHKRIVEFSLSPSIASANTEISCAILMIFPWVAA